MRAGLPWRDATDGAGLTTGRSTAYRLLKLVGAEGEAALEDKRRGHPYKLTASIREWLVERCRGAPGVSGPVLRGEIKERFGIAVSTSQINRARAALGVSNHSRGSGGDQSPPPAEPEWREGAGTLLLLAAAHETGLIDALEAALPAGLPADNGRRHHKDSDCRRSLLLTLLFMPAVGLKRTRDLRGYTGDALALLAGRERAYSYRHTERFLSAVARAGGAETLTDALAGWTAKLWRLGLRPVEEAPPAYYVDSHRKAVHSDKLIPRGLVSRYGKVLGCRALMLLHDERGHPLLATTHRGDTHLTAGVPLIIERYELAAPQPFCGRLIIDREGMAAGFLAGLAREGRDAVTVLRSNQYEGSESFAEVGEFMPLSRDRHGDVTREVAPACYSLPLPDCADERLELRVALVRDLRRRVPCASESGEAPPLEPCPDSPSWFDASWVATAAPLAPTEPALVPIVTTATESDAAEMAKAYMHRWPAQENVIRDWLLPLGLDTNHGYAKKSVPNSEVEKKRTALEKRLANAKRWDEKARLASIRAQKTSDRQWKSAKERSRELHSELNRQLSDLESHGVSEREYRARKKELVDAVEAEMEGHRRGYYRSHDSCNREYAKWERYRREQRELLRVLEDLAASEKRMYELDDSKDQLMTVLKLALANLAMWVRDNYFPAEYTRATWQRLAPFFRLPGRIAWGGETVDVELRPFNDRQLNRDLAAVSALVAQAQLRLPDGRSLLLSAPASAPGRTTVRERRVA